MNNCIKCIKSLFFCFECLIEISYLRTVSWKGNTQLLYLIDILSCVPFYDAVFCNNKHVVKMFLGNCVPYEASRVRYQANRKQFQNVNISIIIIRYWVDPCWGMCITVFRNNILSKIMAHEAIQNWKRIKYSKFISIYKFCLQLKLAPRFHRNKVIFGE